MIMPKKPLIFMNCQTSGGRSARLCVMSQSSSIAHNCSTSLSRKACSAVLSPHLGKASSLFQSGCPLNRSPSHHTVPASIASCSVAEICGRVLRKILRMVPLMMLRRKEEIPNSTMNENSAMYTTCSAASETRDWIATTGTITIIASTQLVMEARKKASIKITTSTATSINIATTRPHYHCYHASALAAKPDASTARRRHFHPVTPVRLGLQERFVGGSQRRIQRLARLYHRNAERDRNMLHLRRLGGAGSLRRTL